MAANSTCREGAKGWVVVNSREVDRADERIAGGLVREIGILISDLPAQRAAATRCGGIFTAGAKHHGPQGLLIEPVIGSAAEVEPAIAGIKGGRDAIDRLGQRQAVPSRQARRDRDSGSRGLAAVLIREGEQCVEQDRAIVLHVAGG